MARYLCHGVTFRALTVALRNATTTLINHFVDRDASPQPMKQPAATGMACFKRQRRHTRKSTEYELTPCAYVCFR
jgi:hypothetical protein